LETAHINFSIYFSITRTPFIKIKFLSKFPMYVGSISIVSASLSGDRHAQGDVCRWSNGTEFRECGDELAEVKKGEAVGWLDFLFCYNSKNPFHITDEVALHFIML
jgi:hypothetical protein